MFCKNCGAAIEEGQTSCPVCGTAVPSESERSVSAQYAYPPATALPMKWYKFLINFMLFFSAALNAIDGVQFIIGDQYYKDGPIDVAKAIYSQFGALKTVDVVAGIVLIAFALFTLYTRSRLAGYCKNGPKMLLLLYILGFAYTVLYAAAVDNACKLRCFAEHCRFPADGRRYRAYDCRGRRRNVRDKSGVFQKPQAPVRVLSVTQKCYKTYKPRGAERVL